MLDTQFILKFLRKAQGVEKYSTDLKCLYFTQQ